MPTYRSITLSLVSQFDILTIPEYAPPATPKDPFSNAPTLIDPKHSTVSVYIPTYPASQFWLSYSISPPHPPKALYYFKLYINNNLIVSWGCGEEDGYKGKTIFGLFDSSVGGANMKQSTIERRVLCFAPDAGDGGNRKFASDDLGEVMEIRVFRSKGRKRVQPDLQEYQSQPGAAHVDKKGAQQQAKGGINLVNAGFLPGKHPKRFYKYALLDPLDQPFATFRYYYRTWDQLEALGVISPSPSIESSSVHSSGLAERPLSPKSSNNTLQSFVTVASFQSNSSPTPNSRSKFTTNTNNILTATQPKDESSTRNTAISLTHNDRTHSANESLLDISPVKITITPTFTIPRPPTPPPLTTPNQRLSLAQLPPSIPSTFSTHSLNTQTSKESFQTLISRRLPSPDANSFTLTNPNENANAHDRGELLSPSSSGSFMGSAVSARTGWGGSSSLGLLREVVNSARKRNRRRATSEESCESHGSRGSRESRESAGSGGSEEVLIGKARVEIVGGAKKSEGSDGSGSLGGSSSGSGSGSGSERKERNGRNKERKPREYRMLNLWEEI